MCHPYYSCLTGTRARSEGSDLQGMLTGHRVNFVLSFISNWMGNGEFRSWDSIATANLLCIGAMAVFTLAVVPFYPGDCGIFGIFSITVLALAAAPLLGRPSFFTLFLVSFLCLGFWLKVVTHFLFGTAFIEPVGGFDQSPAAWDRALLVSAAGIGGVAVAAALCKVIDARRFAPPSVEVSRSRLFSSLGLPLFIASAVIALALFAINYYFAILKVATVPRIHLGTLPTTMIAFTVSWGAILWLGGLTFWLIVGKGLSPTLLFYVAGTEGAIAGMSMISRAQMILHVAAAFLMYRVYAGKLRWRLSLRSWIAVIVAVGMLFAGSMAFVSVERVISFAEGVPPEDLTALRAQNPTLDQRAVTPEKPGVPTEQGLVSDQRAAPLESFSALAAQDHTFDQRTAPLENSAALAAQSYPFIKRLGWMWYEFRHLFIGRWIGVEGVMAVSSAKGLGPELFRDGLFERGEAGVNSIYQKIAQADYEQYSNLIFMTIPGPVAFLYYSGSYVIVAIGMAIIFCVGYTIERFADRSVRNPVVSSLVGASLAYLFVQLNYPRTFVIFMLELIVGLLLIAAFRLFVTHSFGAHRMRWLQPTKTS